MNLNHYYLLKNKRFLFSITLLVISAIFLFSGCYIDFSKYGKYQRRQEVVQMFEKGNLPPDYTYYYAHTVSQPDALIGIEPGYTLDNNLWTRVDPSQLKHLMDNMRILGGYQIPLFGSHIKDPKGKIIGIYYSRWSGGPIVMETENKVNINLPNTKDQDKDNEHEPIIDEK